VLLRALFYTHSPLLIDFVRFLTRAPGYACHYPLAFRLLAQKRTPQADAFFLDFAINDDGERPELTNIMDEYFRQA
ncbi:cytoplasmic protein, partial [Salmonella enterica subsp. enterica serovar Typhimurium]|nr:cytoplasmic protein [Salmonella enterica subsp. enterica serovar Typhimurium]